jgi:hypothetical protein
VRPVADELDDGRARIEPFDAPVRRARLVSPVDDDPVAICRAQAIGLRTAQNAS